MSPTTETEEVVKPRRAPRKRVPKSASEDGVEAPHVRRAARTVSPRKRTPKKEPEAEMSPIQATEPEPVKRKAPTPIASTEAEKRRSNKQLIIALTIIVVGISASAAVGFTDKGQIDVEGTITFRNEQFRASGNESMVIPVQNSPQLPNGGLVGLPPGSEESNPPVPVEQSEIATSTATSTEDGTESEEAPIESEGEPATEESLPGEEPAE